MGKHHARQRAASVRLARVVTPEDRARGRKTYKFSRLGITEEEFNELLAAQGYACGMCHEPFEEDERIFARSLRRARFARNARTRYSGIPDAQRLAVLFVADIAVNNTPKAGRGLQAAGRGLSPPS